MFVPILLVFQGRASPLNDSIGYLFGYITEAGMYILFLAPQMVTFMDEFTLSTVIGNAALYPRSISYGEYFFAYLAGFACWVSEAKQGTGFEVDGPLPSAWGEGDPGSARLSRGRTAQRPLRCPLKRVLWPVIKRKKVTEKETVRRRAVPGRGEKMTS